MFRRKRKVNDFTAEIEAHLQQESERLREQGLTEEDARAAARRSFGNIMQAEERFYESGPWLWLDRLGRDVRFGARMLARNPGFTVTVILTLALSIGANTAIFSIVNALLLKDLPYARPERMGAIYARTTGPDSYDMRRNIDGEQWELLRDNAPSLISAVSHGRTSGMNLQAGSQVQYLQAGRVSAHYFDALALHPVLGRNFSEDEDRPRGPKTAILSYSLWRTVFGASPNALGQAMLLKGEPYTIIGVLSESATTPLNADLYIALQPSREGEGVGTNFQAITRLRDGASWQQADAEMNRAWFRSLRRTAEIATRVALGASGWQIQRQLWIENLLLALLGATAALGLGFLALRSLLLLLPEHFLPVANVPLDGRVLAFTLFLSLLTSIFFGMLPALTTRKVDLRSSFASRGVIGGGKVRLRQGLIAGEVALTVVLLAASGLLLRTLVHLETMPPGFNPNGVMTAKASLDHVRYYESATFRKLLDASLAAMRKIPGVRNAAVGLSLPYERALLSGVILSDGKEAGQEVTTNEVYVTPGYFDTLQIPVLAGRAFADSDTPDAQPVVIINQAFAHKFFYGTNPVGRSLLLPFLNQANKNKNLCANAWLMI